RRVRLSRRGGDRADPTLRRLEATLPGLLMPRRKLPAFAEFTGAASEASRRVMPRVFKHRSRRGRMRADPFPYDRAVMEPDDAQAPAPDWGQAGEVPRRNAAERAATADGAGDLGRALLLAQQVADETIADARRQADMLIAKARVEPVEQRAPAC